MRVTTKLSGFKRGIALCKQNMHRTVENSIKAIALSIQAEAMERIPVDTGALKASGHIDVIGSGGATTARIWFQAAYAIYVHEMPEPTVRGIPRTPSPPKHGNYWDPSPQAGPKYLSKACSVVIVQIPQIIQYQADLLAGTASVNDDW